MIQSKNMKWYLAALLLVLLLAQAGCKKEHEKKHWGYTGDTAPAYWYNLDPAYAIAKDGKAQSPVNIVTADLTAEGPAKPEFHYQAVKFEVENNGHTIEGLPEHGAENYIILDKERYNLQQFHFHAASEHQINGKETPMEVHLVHKTAAGGLAVVGILIEAGKENAGLKELFAKMPAKEHSKNNLDGEINLADLLTGTKEIYRYDGSLTTPPCSEGVKWSLSAQTIELSKEQINAFKGIYNGNNRPVQSLYERKIYIAK
ncbi:MAG: carbonic anhydrase family protein [Spirochaetia bacterium]|jgi:carbonic anhydrase|nr:carbonic anhydrase family protein [Spirochaetia bacterium]